MKDTKLKSFKDLIVWQKSVDLATLIYSVTEKFPKSEVYGIINQMRRAVISISSNIAEGFKRSHNKEKIQFYNIAYASTAELESQIEVSKRLNFVDNIDYQKLASSVVEVGKMADGLIKSQNRKFIKLAKSYILNPIFLLIFLSPIFYILNPSISHASEIFFEQEKSSYALGEEFIVKVYLNAEKDSLNAVEGRVAYPANLLELKEIRDGNSALNFWIEKPKTTSDGNIFYSGLTPGGLFGSKNLLFSIVLSGKKSGKGELNSNSTVVLKNDGLGSKIKNAEGNISVLISKETSETPTLDETEDLVPPENFIPFIGRDPSTFEGKYFIVFSTVDKGIGIDHYEIREGWWGDYTRVESPYILKDQDLKKTYYVKAVDKKDNERTAKVVGQNKISWYQNYTFIGIIILIITFIFRKKFLKFIFKRHA